MSGSEFYKTCQLPNKNTHNFSALTITTMLSNNALKNLSHDRKIDLL